MDDIIRDLIRLGFSDNEAKAYFSILGLGRTSAGSLATRIGINRTTIYDVLRQLQSQGLVSIVKENNENIFIAEPPIRILSLIHARQKKIEDQRRLADPLMLRLQVFHNTSGNKPKIRYIESVDGLRMMQREYEALPDGMIQILGYDSFLKLHSPQVSKNHIEELSEQNKKIRSILITDQTIKFNNPNMEVVVLPTALAPIEGEMTVCGDRLTLFSYSSGIIAVEIHSKRRSHPAG